MKKEKLINQTLEKEWNYLNKLLKLRPKGNPLFKPHELGFACPICNSCNEVDLTWSEFNYMIWCNKCKIDIPSCLCKKYYEPKISNKKLTPLEKLIENKRIFLKTIEIIKEEMLE